MKTLNVVAILSILYWLSSLVALFFGYEPNKVTIGCSFFITTLMFVNIILDTRWRG